MKTLLSGIFVFLLVMAGFVAFQSYQDREKENDDMQVGGDRTAEGCLTSAGYSYSETVGACIREWEMTPDIMEAARIATEHVGKGYALTVVSFNSYEDTGAYDILLERGEVRTQETVIIRDGEVLMVLNHEDAEEVGLQFMQDVIAVAPPLTDEVAEARLYDALSSAGRAKVARATLVRDIALFVGIQDVPDQGVSVEDLEITGPGLATLTLGLNYSGGRVLRLVHLVIEDGAWKVSSVSSPTVDEE
jgi:hypothetical protein